MPFPRLPGFTSTEAPPKKNAAAKTTPVAIDTEEGTLAELNAERGRYWCELAAQVLATPVLNQVDVWLLNEFDLGMARSEQQHTARLLAYALGLNYVWAAEFVELSNGNKQEQARTAGRENRWGQHGNAILELFDEYRQLSGLSLNLLKTVLIPL